MKPNHQVNAINQPSYCSGQRFGSDWSALCQKWSASPHMSPLSRFQPGKQNKILEFGVNTITTTTTAKSLQSCPTLCDPIDGSPPGSAIPGILQARTLEWVAISFSIAWKWKVKVKSLSRVQLVVTPWTAAFQVPLSMGFSRQEYWSGVPLPSPFTCSITDHSGPPRY